MPRDAFCTSARAAARRAGRKAADEDERKTATMQALGSSPIERPVRSPAAARPLLTLFRTRAGSDLGMELRPCNSEFTCRRSDPLQWSASSEATGPHLGP